MYNFFENQKNKSKIDIEIPNKEEYEQADTWSKVYTMAGLAQNRFSWIPKSAANSAGVRDNDLGKFIALPKSFVTYTGYIQRYFQLLGDGLFYLSIIFTGARLHSASKSYEGVAPEAALVTAEYAGAFIGGGTGAKIGCAVGSILGPIGAVTGSVSGSLIGSYYALLFVKSQENVIKENTSLITKKVKGQRSIFKS